MPTASSVLPALLLVGLATTVWVFAPAFHGPAAARRDLGSHRLAIGSVVAVLLLNAMLTLPLAPVLRPTPTTGFTTGTFLIAALATQVPMLVVVYGRLIAPGAVTPRELGLRAMPLGTIVRVGVGAGVIGLILTIVVDVALSQLGLRPNQLDQFRFVRRE